MPKYTGEDAWLFPGDDPDYDFCGGCGHSDCESLHTGDQDDCPGPPPKPQPRAVVIDKYKCSNGTVWTFADPFAAHTGYVLYPQCIPHQGPGHKPYLRVLTNVTQRLFPTHPNAGYPQPELVFTVKHIAPELFDRTMVGFEAARLQEHSRFTANTATWLAIRLGVKYMPAAFFIFGGHTSDGSFWLNGKSVSNVERRGDHIVYDWHGQQQKCWFDILVDYRSGTVIFEKEVALVK